jgi:hypothetical protein
MVVVGAEAPPPATIRDGNALREAGVAFLPGVAATDIDRAAHDVVLAPAALADPAVNLRVLLRA